MLTNILGIDAKLENVLSNFQVKDSSIFLDSSPIPTLVLDEQTLCIEYCNIATELLLEVNKNEIISVEFDSLVHSSENNIRNEFKLHKKIILNIKRRNNFFPVQLVYSEVLVHGEIKYIVSLYDLSLTSRVEKKLALQYELTRIIAESSNYHKSLEKLLEIICGYEEWNLGEIWYVDDSKEYLKLEQMWAITDINIGSHKKHLFNKKIRKDENIIGKVWNLGNNAFIDNIIDEVETYQKGFLSAHNLNSCFAFPIFNNHEVTGVFIFYSSHFCDVSAEFMRLASSLGRQFGDFIEKKRNEQQIIASLKEKEVLLKEIHHRVKNNLQIISSLLNLQSHYLRDSRVTEVFDESRNRIKTMALIHEKLYVSKMISKVNFKEYVTDLIGYLIDSYDHSSEDIKVNIDVEDVELSLDIVVSLGLILNELISNSLKYAFINNKKGSISVKFRFITETRFFLIFKDSGIGFPQGFDSEEAETLGIHLIINLVDQLNGNVKFQTDNGALVSMECSPVQLR